jgi:carbamoyltransferase
MGTSPRHPIHILGISAFYHDSAAALLRDGETVAAAQEERFTRKKGDAQFPRHAVEHCLQTGRVTSDDLDYVVYHEKPWVHFERLVETAIARAPEGLTQFLAAMPVWLGEKLFLRRLIRAELDYGGSLLFADHHESHMAAAFFPSPFESAAILSVDGVGEWATTSWGTGEGNRITVQEEIRFPHSLGLLYSAFTAYLGFRVNTGEYKVMGLAPYGEPRYVQLILERLVDLRADGSFRLDMRFFEYDRKAAMTGRRFNALFGGPPRAPEEELTQRHLDIARSLQVVTEEILLRMARHVHRRTGMRNLVLGGGVALNCVANGRLLREGPFADLWIQPAAGDAGSALGCALDVWHSYLGRPRTSGADRQRGSLLGPAFAQEDVRAILDGLGARYVVLEEEEAADTAAELLAEGRVLGLFRGRMEFGPRALGARSILGDPRRPDMQAKLNLKIKFRESFRPFAPAVLAAHAHELFDLDRPSPYMLLVAPVAAAHRCAVPADHELPGLAKLRLPRSDIPAVTHVDGTARIQTVDGAHSPWLRRILEAFAARTGVGCLINTSFNVRGEPIVCTPEDAYRCFMHTDMDYLLIENLLLDKRQQPTAGDPRWRTRFEAD